VSQPEIPVSAGSESVGVEPQRLPQAVPQPQEQTNALAQIKAMLSNSENEAIEREMLRGTTEGITEEEQALNQLRALPQKMDLSPLMALSDTWFGGNLSKGYTKPLTAEERKSLEIKLKNTIQDQRLKTAGIAGRDSTLKDILKLQQLSQKAEKPSVGEASVDRAFAKEYNDYVAAGGSSTMKYNLNQIDDVIRALEAKEVETGGVASYMPDIVRAKLDPKELAAQEQITSAVMASLRQTLGAQFTEREGRKILETSFNPKLPTSENVKKLRALKQKLSDMAKAKEDSINYFEQVGTLKGFKGGVGKVKKEVSGEDKAALDWANANPTDPRAAQIKQKLGL